MKGEDSPNNTVDWVSRKQFRNPTIKFKANFDNPFKGTNYAKCCMSPSLDFLIFFFISIVELMKFNYKGMHNRLSPNIP